VTGGEPLGVAIIGCGNAAVRYHLPAYATRGDRLRIVGVADPSPERRAEAAAAAGLDDGRGFPDYRPLLERPDVDYVDVCVPPRLHAEIVLAAAAAGRHILCEKPLSTVPAEAVGMLEATRVADVRFGVMHNYLFYPEYVAARRLIAAGEIGEVRLAIVNYLGVPDLPGAGEAAYTWRHDPAASGGGVLMDMQHVLYVAELLLGRRATRVSAFVTGNESHRRVEATALCRLETDGPVALVNVGWGAGPGGVFVEGTRGSIEIRWHGGGTNPFQPLEWLEVRTASGSRREAVASLGLLPQVIHGVGGILDDFSDAIWSARAPAATGDDGLHALELTLAAYQSAAQGRTIEVPLDRAGALFQRGAAAIPELPGPAWASPLRQALYAPDPARP
jgi:UDP-N-acetyl-2-amino-2-deoxyglucuronate dehydrogenase